MTRSSCFPRLRPAILLALLLVSSSARADGPAISNRYPVTSRTNLSPPIVLAPIYGCADVVGVTGIVPKATVTVYANSTEVVGQGNLYHSSGNIQLNRVLTINDRITATQTVVGISSGQSYDPILVGNYPAITTPVMIPKIYECGRVVPVENLIASTRVDVFDLDAPLQTIGTDDTTGSWDPIFTSPLVVNHHVSAQQVACPARPNAAQKSPMASSIPVEKAPNPLPVVSMDVPIVGSDQVVLHHLLVGAELQVSYGATTNYAGFASAADNLADVPPVPPNVPISAAQSLCNLSMPSPPVTATTTVPSPLILGPVCAGSHVVAIENTIPDAYVVLLRAGGIIGYGGGLLGTVKISIGAGVTLHEGDEIVAIQYVSSSYGTFVSPPSLPVTIGCDSPGNVVTQHNDSQRTGVNGSEGTLTPALVLARGMQLKYQFHKPNLRMNAQPLFVHGVAFPAGTVNGLFIASMDNTIYALNADSGETEWSTKLTDSDAAIRAYALGVDATPVIDIPNHRLYVLFGTKNCVSITLNGNQLCADTADQPDSSRPLNDKPHIYQDQLSTLNVAFWLVCLDYRNGQELTRTLIQASGYRSNGSLVSFEARFQRARPSLLLDHGSIYIAFGGIPASENFLDYHGWVMAYRASDLSLQASFCTSPNYAPSRNPYKQEDPVDGAGIWQGGGGLAADSDGNVYFLSGNGTADIANKKYGDAFIKLTLIGSSLVPSAYIPSDSAAMVENDADLGAGGPLAIPNTSGVIGGGKSGIMYLLNSNVMELEQSFEASTNQYAPQRRDDTWNLGPHLHGSATYWRGPDPTFGYLYVWGEKDYLRIYRISMNTGQIETAPFHLGQVKALQDTMPGGILSISSLGDRGGTAIVWATLPAFFNAGVDTPYDDSKPYVGRLYAFNAETLEPLWDTGFPTLGHWLVPTVADGKVFVGTSSGSMFVYELGPERNPATSSWTPYQPVELGVLRPMSSGHWDESVMTSLPKNTLVALAPPSGFTKYAILQGGGVVTFKAKAIAQSRKRSWSNDGISLEIALNPNSELFLRQHPLYLKVSPGLVWSASDGSRAEAQLVKSYTSPDDSGAPWQLYRVKRTSGDGILTGAEYIERVYTRGGFPPGTSANTARNAKAAKSLFEAEYILYRK